MLRSIIKEKTREIWLDDSLESHKDFEVTPELMEKIKANAKEGFDSFIVGDLNEGGNVVVLISFVKNSFGFDNVYFAVDNHYYLNSTDEDGEEITEEIVESGRSFNYELKVLDNLDEVNELIQMTFAGTYEESRNII